MIYFTEIRDEEMMKIFLQAFDDVKTTVSQSTFQNDLKSLVLLMENSNGNDLIIIQALKDIRSLFKTYFNELGLTTTSEKNNENVSFQSKDTDSSPCKNDANQLDNILSDQDNLNILLNSFSSHSLDDQLGNPQDEIQHLFKKLEDQFTKFFVDQASQVQNPIIFYS